MIDTTPPSVGGRTEDRCRICKAATLHTIMAVGADGVVARVICDSCGSQHNYRGGEPSGTRGPSRSVGLATAPPSPTPVLRTAEGASMPSDLPLEQMLRQVIREECGLTPTAPAARWVGGEMVLRPGREGLQEKAIPIETFFQKIVMLRNRLRTLEQQVNVSALPPDQKVKMQGYITACYGSLTSFNILFADDEDRFKGAGGK